MSSMKCVFELDTKRCVLDAIDAGYRSIDTAQAYYNEADQLILKVDKTPTSIGGE